MRDRYYGTTIDRLRGGTEAYTRFGETMPPPPPPDLPPEEEPSIWEKIFQPFSPKVQAWQQRQLPIAAVSDVVTSTTALPSEAFGIRSPTDLTNVPEGQRYSLKFDEQGNPIGLPPPTPESFLQALARKEQTAFGALGQDIAQKVGQVPGVAPAVEWYTTPHAVPEFISKYGEITLSELAESPEGRAAIDALIASSGPTGIFKNLEAGMKQVKAGVRVTAKELHEGEAGFARIGKEIPKAGEAVPKAGVKPTTIPEAKPTLKQTKAMQWVEDEGITDLSGNPIAVDKDGMVTLYHRTSRQSADEMGKTGKFISKENVDETFFSTKPTGQAEGYGDTVVTVKVPAQDIRMDDAFADEIHVAVSNKKLGLRSIVSETPKPTTPSAAIEGQGTWGEFKAKVKPLEDEKATLIAKVGRAKQKFQTTATEKRIEEINKEIDAAWEASGKPRAKGIPAQPLEGQGVEAAGVKGGAGGAIPPAKPPTPLVATGDIPIPPAGITDALAQAKAIVQRDKPGIVTRMIDRIPGLKQLQRKVHPSLGMKDEMVEGWVGQGHTQATVSNTLHADLLPAIKQLESSFGKGATDGAKLTIPFIGKDIERVPFTGTLYDIMQRPQLYNLSPEQRVLLEQIQTNKTVLFRKYKETYGLDIGEFPTAKGAVHVPNVDKSKTAIATAGSESAALRRGRAKERFYETGADRYLHDKAMADKGLLKQEDVFQPNLNVSGLLAADNETLAAMAGQNVFKAALGGKTKLELIEATHPGLFKKMIALRGRLQKLQGYKGVLKEQQTEGIDAFLKSAHTDDDLSVLREALELKPGRYVAKAQAGKVVSDIEKEITGVRGQIAALQPAWRTANPRGHVMVQEGGLYRYFPVEDAKELRRLTKVSESKTLRVVDELRATAFGGDLSPGTIQGLTAWELDPIGVSKAVGQEMKLAAKDRQLLRGFSKEGLAADIAANPESWQRYSMATGLNPLGMFQREEFGTGFIARIPKVGKKWAEANDALFRGLVKLSKSSFDSIYEVGIKKGLSSEQAAAIAADDVTKLIPSYSYRRLGMSQAEAARYRAALTSVSFLTQPAALMSDATKGILKLVTLQPINPTEAYAVKRVLTLSTTVSSVATISHTMYAVNNGKDPVKAALASITPGDPYFWSLVLPNGDRIGLGGPFRSLLRAVAPGNVEGVPVPVPFAGLYRFSFSKMHPAWRIAYDEIRDKDFYGKQIRSGDFPINILQGLEYALESSMPLTAGGVLEDIRRGETKQIPSDVISQFAGVNLTPENKIWNMKREWKDDLDKYESIPTSALEVKERGIPSRDQYRKDNPVVDAKLFITGQVSSIQSEEADSIVKKILEVEKIDPMTINVVKKWSPEVNARRLNQGLKDTLTDSLIKDLRKGK